MGEMRQSIHLIIFVISALLSVGCAVNGREADKSDFATALRQADSVYNQMEFNKAYELYLKMLTLPEVKQDNAKLLETLYSLSIVSEMASQKNDQMTWVGQLLSLARNTNNNYYLSQGLMLLGKHVYYEGDHSQGISYIREAIDLMSRTERHDTDHMTHSQLNVLSTILADMHDLEAAIETDKRNVNLTYNGSRWGTYPQIQMRDQRTALAKLAVHYVRAGQSARADSTYERWKAVPIENGSNPRDYFIVDYLRERGCYSEAAHIYEGLIAKLRTQSDTLSNMMLFAKLGLAEVEQKMEKYCRASDLYVEVLEISDTLRTRLARSNAQELSVLYETQEKEQQLQVRKMWIIGLCSGAAVLTVIIVAMLIHLCKIQKKNRFMVQALDELASRQALNDDTGEQPLQVKTEEDGLASMFISLDRQLDSGRLYLNPYLNRDDLCRLIGVDKNTLGNIIRQYSNAANSQTYINRKRVQYAILLLREHPEWTMLAVAEACGMRNTVTFNRTFRQTYGMTPTEYVKIKNKE